MLRHAALLAAVIAVFVFLTRGTAWYGPYTYDEADYMYAAGRGFAANWIDSPTTSLIALVKSGWQRGRARSQQTELSEAIRDSGDILFYRHWHGPVYVAWLDLAGRFVSGERPLRACNLIFAVLTALLMYRGALWLLPGAAGEAAAVLAAVLYLWDYAVVRASELAPHQVFAFFVTAALLCLARMWQAAPRRWWYRAIAAAAVAFCVLEVAFALLLTLLACAWFARQRLKPDARGAARSAGLFLILVVAIWPGAVFKLSVVKSYLFMAYLAIFRHNAWGPDLGFADTWLLRLAQSPVPWILFAGGLVYYWRHRRDAPMLIPFAAFALFMFLAIARVNTPEARYVLTILPGVVLLGSFAAGLMLASHSPARRAGAVALLCAAMFFTSWPRIRTRLPRPNRRAEAMLALITPLRPRPRALLVPHGDVPMLHYYFPAIRFRSYSEENEIASRLREEPVDAIISGADSPRLIRASAVPQAGGK